MRMCGVPKGSEALLPAPSRPRSCTARVRQTLNIPERRTCRRLDINDESTRAALMTRVRRIGRMMAPGRNATYNAAANNVR